MPEPTPFHPRTFELCTSMFYKDWAGYYAVRSYDTCHEREYYAIRHATGLIDVSPLQKYEVRGRDAAALLSRTTVRDVRRMKVGRVTYLCWCDDDGKVVDDGTVTRLDEQHFRVTANAPNLAWFERNARGLDVTIEDSTGRIGALALQGPTSRDVLKGCTDADLDGLRYFRAAPARLDGCAVWISRTGYTGDLGYEVWTERDDALRVWDALVAAGRPYRLQPTGLDAMDVTRIEAGFVLHGVDYFNARRCLIASRKSSPYEIGLGWTVKLERDPFTGQAALATEHARGSEWTLVGLQYDWDEFEALFNEVGLPPQMPPGAWRDAVPVFDRSGQQVGQATSGAWSPLLKKNLALASVRRGFGEPGTELRVEVTVEYRRQRVTATVTGTPFFDPPRKKA